MAAPVQVYGPRWEVALTDAMAFAIARSAAGQGRTKSEWIREACEQRLARERHRRRDKAKRVPT